MRIVRAASTSQSRASGSLHCHALPCRPAPSPPSSGLYYYKTPADNQWSSIDLGQLAQRTQQGSDGVPQARSFAELHQLEQTSFKLDAACTGPNVWVDMRAGWA